MIKRTAALHNLGCKVNSYETESMRQMLVEAGYEIVDFTDTADVYVINTCSVTNIADRKSRQMLRRAKHNNPDAVIVATGCYVQTAGESVKDELGVDILLGNNQKVKLIELLEAYFIEQTKKVDIIDINDGVMPYEEFGTMKHGEHTRAFLKVQDGCNQFCSYCIIPYARGRIRSRDPQEVSKEVRTLAENGYQEIVLTGIHLSSYGVGEDFHLLELVKSVHEIDKIKRIRLGSLEPRIITEEFISELVKLPKVCPHFHLSLQSGCDETLKRMNRKYDTTEYEEKCRILRSYYEHPAITTDVIVGFPGETEEEFACTKEFLDRISFYEMHVFPYSKRKGTRAAVMSGQLREAEKKARSAVLLELEKEQSRQYRAYYIGRTCSVLAEEACEIEGKWYMTGYTPEYVRVAIPIESKEQASLYENQLVWGTISQMLTDDLLLLPEAIQKVEF